eukprot:m.746598 g.746598  ORF g.746598 m.746598 type:complete len:990 (-) comp23138_c0_seq5:248-3217(-)
MLSPHHPEWTPRSSRLASTSQSTGSVGSSRLSTPSLSTGNSTGNSKPSRLATMSHSTGSGYKNPVPWGSTKGHILLTLQTRENEDGVTFLHGYIDTLRCNNLGDEPHIKIFLTKRGKDIKPSKRKLTPKVSDKRTKNSGVLKFEEEFKYDLRRTDDTGRILVSCWDEVDKHARLQGAFSLSLSMIQNANEVVYGWFLLLPSGQSRTHNIFCGEGDRPDIKTTTPWLPSSAFATDDDEGMGYPDVRKSMSPHPRDEINAAAAGDGDAADDTAPHSRATSPLAKHVQCADDAVENFVCSALYAYNSGLADELSFEVGDQITVTRKRPSGWWAGQMAEGRNGWFPSTFVKVLDTAPDATPDSTQEDTVASTHSQSEKEETADETPELPKTAEDTTVVLQARIAQLEGELEFTLTERDVAPLRDRIIELEAQHNADATAMAKANEAHGARVTALQDELTKAQTSYQAATVVGSLSVVDIAEAHASANADKDRLHTEITQLKASENAIRTKFEDLATELKAQQSAMEDHTASKIALKASTEEFETALAATKTTMQAALDAARAENSRLQTSIAQLKQQHAASARAQQSVLSEQVEQLQLDLTTAQTAAETSRAEAHALRSQLDAATDRLADVECRHSEATTALAETQTKLAHMETSFAAQTATLAQLEETDTDAQATVKALRSRVHELEDTVTDKESECTSIRAESTAALAAVRAQLEVLHADAGSSATAMQELRSENTAHASTIQRLQSELANARVDVGTHAHRATELEDTVHELKVQLRTAQDLQASAEAQVGTATAARAAADERCTRLQHEHAVQADAVVMLETTRETHQRTIRDLEEQLATARERCASELRGRKASEEREETLHGSLAAQRREMEVLARTSHDATGETTALRARVGALDKVHAENEHLHAILNLKADADLRQRVLLLESRLRTLAIVAPDTAHGADIETQNELVRKLLDRVTELDEENGGLREYTQKLMKDLMDMRLAAS